jgi:hypothetical protein
MAKKAIAAPAISSIGKIFFHLFGSLLVNAIKVFS